MNNFILKAYYIKKWIIQILEEPNLRESCIIEIKFPSPRLIVMIFWNYLDNSPSIIQPTIISPTRVVDHATTYYFFFYHGEGISLRTTHGA